MARHRSKIFSERELEIMNALWDLRKASVREIREHLGGDKAGAYTSIATMLKFLEHKGAAKHTIAGRTYFFEPRITKQRAAANALKYVLRGYFSGSPETLVKTLVGRERLSRNQLQEIMSIIKEAESNSSE